MKNINLLTAAVSRGVTHFFNEDFVTAAAAALPEAPTTVDERTLTGLVLPFGREGRTSAGRLSVTAGAITTPEDIGRVKLYRDHSDVGGTPVGKATGVEVKEDGIYMSFRIGSTPDGDAAIADVAEGIRDALSVELIDTVTAGGVLSAGVLTAVALVPVPAFDDARVTSAFVGAVDEDEDEDEDDTDDTDGQDTDEDDEDKDKDKTTASRRGSTLTTRLATKRTTANLTGGKKTMKLSNVAATIAGKINGDASVTAALATITEAGQPAVVSQEWLGELFNDAPFERLIVPTFKQRTLTQMKLKGWRWTTRPEVDDYAGNLAEIPSNAIETEPVEVDAARIAGGHKIDRKYIDFADSEFIQSYLREMTDSYKKLTDSKAAQFILDEADAVATVGAQPTLLHAAAKANQVIFRNLRKYATTFLVNPDDLFELFDVTMMDEPRYLELFKIDPASFIPDESVTAGNIVAYHKDSVAWGELPGSPIRVDALDVAHGGSDNALFGYWAALIEDSRGVTMVPFGNDGGA